MFHEKGCSSQLVLLLEVTHWTTTLNDNTTAVCLQENTIIFYHKGAAHSPSGIGSVHAHKLLMLLVSISIFVFVQLRICVQKESLTTITAP